MPRGNALVLDASVITGYAAHKGGRDKAGDGIEFTFPYGFNAVDLMAQCRVLNDPDDFDTVYNFTVTRLTGKEAVITLKHKGGVREELCRITASDWGNLRGIASINRYPVLVVWLTETVAARLSEEITDAWERSAADSEEAAEETERGDDGGAMVRTYFGDEMLYVCYEFYEMFKHKPYTWSELFDFLRFIKVKSIQKKIALQTAGEGVENG
jgi:hypothetical protein